MKAEELRIGNLVLNDGCVCEILHIYGGDFINLTLKTKQGNSINAHYELLQGVPLNEEWLVKFGGLKNQHQWLIGEIMLGHITTDENYEFEWQMPLLDWRITSIKHIHQLQNLYHALTGEELKIT